MTTILEHFGTPNAASVPKIFAKAFWGFDMNWGTHVGFTKSSDKAWFLEHYKDGDLLLIYGASGGYTSSSDSGKILGFVTLGRFAVPAEQHLSAEANAWLSQHRLGHRWNHALPIRQAWKCLQPVQFRHLASQTYDRTAGRTRGSRGVELMEHEAREILKLRVEPVVMDRSGRSRVVPKPAFEPSQAVPFCATTTVKDGPRRLYLAKFAGAPELLLLGSTLAHRAGQTIAKVGFAKSPDDRMDALNQGFPTAARHNGFRWQAGMISQDIYENYEAACKVENILKAEFAKKFESLGGEFFIGPWGKMESAFISLTVADCSVIRGSVSDADPNLAQHQS